MLFIFLIQLDINLMNNTIITIINIMTNIIFMILSSFGIHIVRLLYISNEILDRQLSKHI